MRSYFIVTSTRTVYAQLAAKDPQGLGIVDERKSHESRDC
jgi:hypothetical protein